MRPRTAVLAIALAVTAAACHAQAGFTDPREFDSAVERCRVYVMNGFDAQADGSPASQYGMLRISASGLASDGARIVALNPTATADYPPVSRDNSLGTAGQAHSFLAGNGDVIAFRFSMPVHALGLFLIGNPSPTGDPAIPFWRLATDIPNGHDVFSATTPLDTLDKGSDVYFLGIVSRKAPFTEATLHSDNDLAAAYSFNVDDVIFAVDAEEVPLGKAKEMTSGEVVVADLIVTRVHSDRFNVETEDRSLGMAVEGTGATRGKRISLFGGLATNSDGERVIELGHILSEADATPPRPLGMATRSVGGSQSVGLQIGCLDAAGPNNIGLDVRVWGRITAISPDSTWLTIDDGAGRPSGLGPIGLAVSGQISAGTRQVGDIISVTGSSSMFGAEDGSHSLIRVAGSEDIVEQ